MDILPHVTLDSASEIPLYRQLASSIRSAIDHGALSRGDRLPPTRELAGLLGLNRTTISAAYALLEEAGLLEGQVGRGSFVAAGEKPEAASRLDWEALLAPLEPASPTLSAAINFATSRPAEEFFPLAQFRSLAREVIDGPEASEILQLGSPYGYAPLRRHLLARARAAGEIRPGDDLIITNGCQQALDLLARIFIVKDTPAVVEDPVYHGMLRVFSRAGASLLPIPVGDSGLNLHVLEATITQHRPRLLVVTPDFQNPTGATLSIEQRKTILSLAGRAGLAVIESQVYRDLRYSGRTLPSLKQLDQTGNVISIGSYSKIAFPGLRVGWVIAPRPVIARLAEAKQTSDLHSDQLSQAVLLRFAESGELARHLEQSRHAGAERLRATFESCSTSLPPGSRFTRPEGGMNLWIDLPAPLTADDLLRAVGERGVSFLPGNYFSVRHAHRRGLRISFGGLAPEQISRGIALLGDAARELLSAERARVPLEPAAALV